MLYGRAAVLTLNVGFEDFLLNFVNMLLINKRPGAIVTFLHELVEEEPEVLAPAGVGKTKVLLRRKQPLKYRRKRGSRLVHPMS